MLKKKNHLKINRLGWFELKWNSHLIIKFVSFVISFFGGFDPFVHCHLRTKKETHSIDICVL